MHPPELVKTWLERILSHEGKFTRNPADPGNWTGGKLGVGKLKGTKYGIAANTYGHLDIKNLTIDDAVEIYTKDYLRPLRADRYRDGVAFQLLDFAINSGPNRAIKSLQKAIQVTPDGVVGPITMKTLRSYEEYQMIMLLIAQRLRFWARLKVWLRFGKGWAIRAAINLEYGALDS